MTLLTKSESAEEKYLLLIEQHSTPSSVIMLKSYTNPQKERWDLSSDEPLPPLIPPEGGRDLIKHE